MSYCKIPQGTTTQEGQGNYGQPVDNFLGKFEKCVPVSLGIDNG